MIRPGPGLRLGRSDRSGRSGDCRRGVAFDPKRPRRHARQGGHSQPAGHRRFASRAVAAAVAERGRHPGRKRRTTRSHAFLHALRLRGQCRQSVLGLRGHKQTPRRRRSAPRHAGRSTYRSIHNRREKGHFEDHFQDGHFHAAQLPCRPAVRGRGLKPRSGRQILHRHRRRKSKAAIWT